MTKQDIRPKSETPFERFFTIDQLAETFGVTTMTIRRWMEDDKFPQPKRFGKRLIRWCETDIRAYIATK